MDRHTRRDSGQIIIELLICFIGFSAAFVAVLNLLGTINRRAHELRFQPEVHHERLPH
jgi:hypothetical protein